MNVSAPEAKGPEGVLGRKHYRAHRRMSIELVPIPSLAFFEDPRYCDRVG